MVWQHRMASLSTYYKCKTATECYNRKVQENIHGNTIIAQVNSIGLVGLVRGSHETGVVITNMRVHQRQWEDEQANTVHMTMQSTILSCGGE